MTGPGMFELHSHGGDTFVGQGPKYPWGGLYGGQIVAQALRAAAETVETEYITHSLRAYFIRRGDHREPVRYEVDRIRNGRSFVTRRVVARQAVGAILNLEASFQADEPSPALQTVAMPDVPGADGLEEDSWLDRFLRRDVPGDSVMRSHPNGGADNHEQFYGASLDHTIWFHRPMWADEWHLYDATCHAFNQARGLAFGHVFAADGTHTATFAQEFLAREVAPPATASREV